MILLIAIILSAAVLLPLSIWSSRVQTRSAQGLLMVAMVAIVILLALLTSYTLVDGIFVPSPWN
jgi:hypothetical protein